MNKRFLLYTLLAIPCLVISSYPILKKYSSVELSDSNIVLLNQKISMMMKICILK